MLELDCISKSYKGKKVVDQLSFALQKGQVLGMLGENGAGKSTTLSMIATLSKPDSGKILFFGQDITKQPDLIRKKLGYVPQDIALYETLTGLDNLKFFGRMYHLDKRCLLKRIFWISEIIGFTEEILNQKVKFYSGGMKRKLNIAVSLLHQPELVVLDEPTVGIDLVSRNQILFMIKELSSLGAGILYVGHYLEEIEQICDRICILDRGSCCLEGDLHDLLDKPKGKIRLEELYTECQSIREVEARNAKI